MVSPLGSGSLPDQRDLFEYRAFVSGRYLRQRRKANHFVAAGDHVICEAGDIAGGPYPIVGRKQRRGTLLRKDPFYHDRIQVIGANIDQMVIVSSMRHPQISWHLIDQYVVYAELHNIEVVLVFSKQDLLKQDTQNSKELFARLATYGSLGYQVLRTSIPSKDCGYEVVGGACDDHKVRLRELLSGKISLFTGMSGVGKSTLINFLVGNQLQKVSPSYRYGRHTTSSTRLIALDSGSYIMDTPGIKSFPLQDHHRCQLASGFAEFRPFLGQCRFASCTHRQEPGCAIKSAVADGKVVSWRYQSYLSIRAQMDSEILGSERS